MISLEIDEEHELNNLLRCLFYGVTFDEQYAMAEDKPAHVNRVGIVRKILARLGRELPPGIEEDYQHFAPLLPPGCEGSLWNQVGGQGTPECMHWRDGSRTDECRQPARWRAWVRWAELSVHVCEDHHDQIVREDERDEPEVEDRWQFEEIGAPT